MNYSSTPRKAALNDFIVKPKKRNPHHHHHHHHPQQQPQPQQPTPDVNDNDLVREMRQKLKGKNLRDVIIDGANIGRTFVSNRSLCFHLYFFFRYGGSEFSARGIKLAVDLFQSYGYPDSKISVILPAHYLSKDKDHVFPDLIHRKIVHKAFQQKIGDQNKRFYDDR